MNNDGLNTNHHHYLKEAETGVITLPDDDPEIVKLMIDYFYTLDCPPFPAQVTAPPPVMVLGFPPAMSQHRTIGAILESDSKSDDPFSSLGTAKGKKKKHAVPMGKEPAKSPQEPDGTSHLITLAKMYAIADKYGIKGLQSLSQDKFKLAAANNWNHSDLPSAIYTVYTSTPDSNTGLRDIVVNLISGRMSLLRKPKVEALMREFNGLAFDLLKLKYLNSGGVWS